MTPEDDPREKLIKQASKNFLEESARELKGESVAYAQDDSKRTVWGCLFRTYIFLTAMLFGVFIFQPACNLDVIWDSTVLDIETYSVTRTVDVEVANLNWYDNKMKDLTVAEYVRTCYKCEWELVERYALAGEYTVEGYDQTVLSLESMHQGIDVERALEISKACVGESLSIRFEASWLWSGVRRGFKNQIEEVYCEFQEPYELSVTSYAPASTRDLTVDANILADDRIEQIKNILGPQPDFPKRVEQIKNILDPQPDFSKRVGGVRGSQ